MGGHYVKGHPGGLPGEETLRSNAFVDLPRRVARKLGGRQASNKSAKQ